MPRSSSAFLFSTRGRCCVPRDALMLIARYGKVFWEPQDPADEF